MEFNFAYIFYIKWSFFVKKHLFCIAKTGHILINSWLYRRHLSKSASHASSSFFNVKISFFCIRSKFNLNSPIFPEIWTQKVEHIFKWFIYFIHLTVEIKLIDSILDIKIIDICNGMENSRNMDDSMNLWYCTSDNT